MSERRQRDKIVPVRFHRETEYPDLLEAASLGGYRHVSTYLRALALKKPSHGTPLVLVQALGDLARLATKVAELAAIARGGALPTELESEILVTLADVRAAAKRIHR